MKNFQKTTHLSVLTILQIIIFCSYSYSSTTENQKSNPVIKFSNTVFIEHFSDILYNNVRTQHNTTGDKPSLYLDEKFQIYLLASPASNDEKSHSVDFGCMVPSSYLSANFVYKYDENFAVRAGGEIEWGSGNYKNPFISTGIGLTSFNDMVFKHSQRYPNFFLNYGHRDDIHLSFDIAGNQIVFADASEEYINSDNFDISLGYKKVLPLFLRFNLFETETSNYNIPKEEQLIYKHVVSFMHLQYYGDYRGISAGYIYNKEEYNRKTYINGIRNTKGKIGYNRSQGGGLTFYVKNSDSSFEVTGEVHLLADSDMNWMNISKFGVRVYF